LEITPPTVISLAKREEEIFIPNAEEPLRLSRHAYALRLLQYVRDEAHRFAQHYHKILPPQSPLRRETVRRIMTRRVSFNPSGDLSNVAGAGTSFGGTWTSNWHR